MKIAQVCTRYFPAIGGVEEYVRKFSEGLVKKRHIVKVFTTNLKHHFSREVIKEEIKNLNGVTIKRHSAFPLRFRKYTIIPALPFSLLIDDSQIIHTHSFMYFCSDASSVISKIKRKPLVFNPYLSKLESPSFFGKIYRKTLGKLLMNAECVIVISEYEKKLVESWGYKPKRLEVIPPGVALDEFEEVKYNIFKERNIEGKVILFVGRLDYLKGVDILIKAFKIINGTYKDLKLVVAGPDFGILGDLKKIAKELELEEKVYFLGTLIRADLISAYKNAYLFVLPSRYEAFGIVLIEAMAAGIPVIATRHSAIPYVASEGKEVLLFELNDYRDLASKILKLVKDEKLYFNLSNNGREKVKENYLWDENISKLEKLYKTLI